VSEPSDMSTPVTRGELRHELNEFEHRVDQKFEVTRAEITAQDQRFDRKLDAVIERMDAIEHRTTQRMADTERRLGEDLARQFQAMETRLGEDLARHIGAVQESIRTMISVVDDKYADLPGRVTALEDNRAPTPPRKRRRRAS
jgi:phage shock protein A